MPESADHKSAKDAISKFLADNYGLAVSEYLDSGFEMDVSSVVFPARKIMVEVIWSPGKQNFYRDLNIVLCSDAEIKIVVVNPKILEKKDCIRYFDRIRVGEEGKGYSIIGMLPWNGTNETSVLETIKKELEKVITVRTEQISETIKRIKEEIFDKNIPLSVTVSNCIDLAKKLDEKEAIEWLKCELYGYYEYIKPNSSMSYSDLPGKPNYRKINGKINVYFGPGNMSEVDYPILITQPINEIVALVNNTSSRGGREIAFTFPTPDDIKKILKKNRLVVPAKIPVIVPVIGLSQLIDRLRVAVHKSIDELRY